jgi:hypothetical protein
LSSYSPPSRPLLEETLAETLAVRSAAVRRSWIPERFALFATASFLVSVPVFLQAPLVRSFPVLSLLITGIWVIAGLWLYARPKTQCWGDLLIGFSWTWFAGSIYWGWLRAEPLLHLPVEALGLPIVLWLLSRQQSVVGGWFYLGSLLGTAITDLYFYALDLIPVWRQLMQSPPESAASVLQVALTQVLTSTGFFWASLLVTVLILVGTVPLRSPHLWFWGFGGAVLSTLLVDSLFFLAAISA